jgi:hypothetical protein
MEPASIDDPLCPKGYWFLWDFHYEPAISPGQTTTIRADAGSADSVEHG